MSIFKKEEKKIYTKKQMEMNKEKSFNSGVLISFATIAALEVVGGVAKCAWKCALKKKKEKELVDDEEFESDDFDEEEIDGEIETDEKTESEEIIEDPDIKPTATVQEEAPSESITPEKKAEDVEHVAVVVERVQVPTVDDKPVTPEEIKEFAGIDLDAVKALAEYIDKMPKSLREEVSNTIKDGKFPKVEGVDPDAVKRLGNFMMEAGIKEEPIPEPSEDKSEDEKSEDESSSTTEEKEEKTA